MESEMADIHQEYGALLVRYAFSVSRDRELARDAAQVCFFRYFLHRRSGGTVENTRAWLFRVAKNYLLDRLRESNSRGEVSISGLDERTVFAADERIAYEQREALSHMPRLLSPREMECVQLRQQGLSYEEIAAEMNISQGTVGALLARALKKLRAALTWL